jgi:hypothetical protein
MFLNYQKNVITALFFFFVSACGVQPSSGGHDPNQPIPVFISDSKEVIVDHTKGAIIKTPDGMAMLSILPTALKADTTFKITPYDLSPGEVPFLNVGKFYSISPTNVSTLLPGALIEVTLYYDVSQFPIIDSRENSPTNPYIYETDMRIGLFQDNTDATQRCWSSVLIGSPPIIAGPSPHKVISYTVVLGIVGITPLYSYTCPYNFIYPPKPH